jgi:pimeloyl-ACP methyl ester carboxylesterase
MIEKGAGPDGELRDDDLSKFAADGAAPLPPADEHGHVEHDGARIWYATYGHGSPVLLLHGGLGNSENWGYQVPVLIDSGHRVVLIDSRGHGRSTYDSRTFSYELMASDVRAVMDAIGLSQAAIVGWSDGAIIGLILAMKNAAGVTRVFALGGPMDVSGNKPISPSDEPILGRIMGRHAKDYARLSARPADFKAFSGVIGKLMETEPNYNAGDLARIRVPTAIVDGEYDEFLRREHIEYLARTIPGATLIILPGVTHFAPLQRPGIFNAAMLSFLDAVPALP